ncbi:MAG TPA: Glu/Leu/Phe/Val dehydrogenase dimerization domain-containing protein [Balneolales bacterium]|nr:Glu/Leu/Phe/Val dehydrogenase dimerization domain-containing protein [Balneolales bacterium]
MDTTTLTAKKVDKNFSLFNRIESKEHEQVVICSEPKVGLRAIIAIHNTTLGPALGGTRMWPYKSEEEAIRDVLRLSRGMTYKAAVAGLNLGGGKAVIIGDPKKDKNEALFRAYGRFIEGLAGRYITAEDVGTDIKDMEWVRMETKYVTGISRALGGSGDPSSVTALGTYMGMKACAQKRYGSDSLKGKKVAVQGAGHVSSYLVDYLVKEGAKVFITDIFDEKVRKIVADSGATAVKPDEIYGLDVDIFSPCALGGIVNSDTIPQLKCNIIAGSANNQLDDENIHGQMLIDHDIMYAPDYVINAGGLINVSNELEGYNYDRAHEQAERIYDVILDILNHAEANNIPTYMASNELAEKRLQQIGRIKEIYASRSQYSGRLGELNKHHL